MRILGIDPGYGRTGYGVVDVLGNRHVAVVYGCIETVPHAPTGERLRDIFLAITAIIEQQKPEVVAIEQLFFHRNVTTAFAASEARGVVVLAAQLANIQQVDYTPLQVKQAVVGYGRAEKSQVQQMVKVLLGLREIPKPDDAADALAIALAHAQAHPYLERVTKTLRAAGHPQEEGTSL